MDKPAAPQSRAAAVTFAVPIGDSDNGYQLGNYLNAINEVTAFFTHSRHVDVSQLKAALSMYAGQVEA